MIRGCFSKVAELYSMPSAPDVVRVYDISKFEDLRYSFFFFFEEKERYLFLLYRTFFLRGTLQFLFYWRDRDEPSRPMRVVLCHSAQGTCKPRREKEQAR